ncbi:MAG: hypothetical protein JSR91_00365 [Proteobacteria bacterium]|nr:hypothetical protein [Pseudomonadota bacterium]
MTMDVDKLRSVIQLARKHHMTRCELSSADAAILADAAERHLATLPKVRQVWYVLWRERGITHAWEANSAGAADVFAASTKACPERSVIATVGPFEVPEND